ncbi:polysaccharide pyruvyl transferase family protein [Microbacterium sp. 2FI]|uniref:polysaccharide pyruvyl transferase family protein n=1 Tax=Microbacterium sp. 2FI TaxID=2502193 RepID=UPI0014858659|nr:polysaccharide pyruvyl transferase family protein [Microbacterium sp. 2FI]
MIHGNAPFEMFPEAVFYKDRRFGPGGKNFAKYVNDECSHLIVTVANFFKLNDEDGARYSRFQGFLEKIEAPIVIFGLGAQAPSQELDGSLPDEAIDLMKFLGDRSELVGVRGSFTADMFEHFAGVSNTFVTGCPSFFSRPDAFPRLAEALKTDREGRAAYNGTTYHDPLESDMLVQAIQEDSHLVEPVNRFSTAYANSLQRNEEAPPFPWFLKRPVKEGKLTHAQLEDYFSRRFRIFRDPASWYNFNSESVGFSYGTRFHANMASLLSGVPAVWVTHDSRTEELTKVLRVPAVPKESVSSLSSEEIRSMMDYKPMFDGLGELFANFNAYLEAHKLPLVSLPDFDSPFTE